MYIWGFFNMFSKNNDTLTKVKGDIETEVARIRCLYENDEAYLSDWCLVRFMQGVILRFEGKFLAAEVAFKEVIMQ